MIQCIEGLDAELEGNSLPYFEILKDGKAVLGELVRTVLIVAVEIAVPNIWVAFWGRSWLPECNDGLIDAITASTFAGIANLRCLPRFQRTAEQIGLEVQR